jgi:hypothetical protein
MGRRRLVICGTSEWIAPTRARWEGASGPTVPDPRHGSAQPSMYAGVAANPQEPSWFTWRHGRTGAKAGHRDRGWSGDSCPICLVGDALVVRPCPAPLVVSNPHGSRGVRAACSERAGCSSWPTGIHRGSAAAASVRTKVMRPSSTATQSPSLPSPNGCAHSAAEERWLRCVDTGSGSAF